MSLTNTFTRLQNKVFVDSRDYPVELTESFEIEGSINDSNRKIKLSDKVHSFDSLIVYKVLKTSESLDIRMIGYENLAIHYSPIDVTVNYTSYDATHDVYNFNMIIYRGDTYEVFESDYTVQGALGASSIIVFSTIQGNFTIIPANFIAGAKAVFTFMGYENAILVVDSLNSFVTEGVSNHLQFNIPANAIYLNELPYPQSLGDITLLVKYLGLGSIITAQDMNDVVNIVKYYNLLPKFDVTKFNNSDIKLYVHGEYYYMASYIEKFDDAIIQLEDEVLIGQQNVIVGFLDVANHIFNVRRCAVGATYNEVISDLTEFIVENPDYEIPLFIMIFDTNKNIYEYAYVNNTVGIRTSGGGTVNKVTVDFTNVTTISLTMTSESYPIVSCQDENDEIFIPDSVEKSGNVVRANFFDPQTGVLVVMF